MKRRCLTKLVVFLLAGAIINVAVAWTLALTVPLYSANKTRGMRWNEGTSWELQKWTHATGIGLYSARMHVSGFESDGFGPDPESFHPRWSTLHIPRQPFVNDTSSVEVREAEGRGWPLI